MFDDILQMVKEHMGSNPETAAAIPPEQADAIHQEIATHISNGLNQPQPQTAANPSGNGFGGILSSLSGSLQSGNLLTSSIAGGLVGSLGSKFGLSPAITGAIAASLPGLLQKLEQRSR
jgi:hypothetical protein